jgi:hypothetical protein
VLALVPAGFLVLVLLAALAVDSAAAYLYQRELHDALAAAANDAVAASVDNSSFYGTGALTLDGRMVAEAVCQSLEAQGVGQLHGLSVSFAVSGDSVLLAGHATVNMVFGRAIPGWGRRQVSSTAEATLASAAAEQPPSKFGPLVPLGCALWEGRGRDAEVRSGRVGVA